MAFGHVLDADTFALWRLDETQERGSTYADSGSGGATLVRSGVVGVKGFGSTYVPDLRAGQYLVSEASNAASVAALVDEWTFEAWIYLEAHNCYLATYTKPNDDGSSAYNYLLAVIVQPDGRLQTWWEYNTGINVDVFQTTGASVPLRTWTHVAVRKRLVLGVAEVDFFINGEFQETVGGLTNSSHGESTLSRWYIGSHGGLGGDLYGSIHDIRISNIPRSSAEIATSAATASHRHTLDANALHLWRLDEPPDLKDISPSGNHLVKRTGTFYSVESLIDDRGSAVYLDAATQYYAWGNESWRNFWLGEWTIELWTQLVDNAAASRVALAYHGADGSDAQVDNYLARSQVVYSAPDFYGELFWENGAGVNQTFTTTSSIITGANKAAPHHLAWRKRSDGAGQFFMDFFSNGALIESGGPFPNADGGTSNIQKFVLGGQEGVYYYGRIDDVRLSSKSRANSEILRSYTDGAAPRRPRIIVVGGL